MAARRSNDDGWRDARQNVCGRCGKAGWFVKRRGGWRWRGTLVAVGRTLLGRTLYLHGSDDEKEGLCKSLLTTAILRAV